MNDREYVNTIRFLKTYNFWISGIKLITSFHSTQLFIGNLHTPADSSNIWRKPIPGWFPFSCVKTVTLNMEDCCSGGCSPHFGTDASVPAGPREVIHFYQVTHIQMNPHTIWGRALLTSQVPPRLFPVPEKPSLTVLTHNTASRWCECEGLRS